ncbi:hypothetical protein Taro_024342 [Colocasia esculenta]|uniref:Membrane-bound transcription factor site-1 protease-like N-terminal domain-containing protein n=1 Tax=Colocasia esculenta TaxID=4460 RepID=A0A843VK41_COLES|nr:hypothetical protein [Colocasia esculenta]
MSGPGPVFHSSWFFAVFLVLSLFLPCHDPSACVPPSHSPEPERPGGTQAGNYIVRFREYRKAGEHRVYVEESLGSIKGWRWVERRNPASSFPTDFGLLAIEDVHRSKLIEELGRLELVKDVIVDSSYTRSLSVHGGERGLSFSGVTKRPGKIFTSMSREGEQVCSQLSNSTLSWRRKLLMQFVRVMQ